MNREIVLVDRFMIKDIFGINDREIDQVVKFMRKDYKNILDVIKMAADSELTEHQKLLVSYIVGNKSGVIQVRELMKLPEKTNYQIQECIHEQI